MAFDVYMEVRHRIDKRLDELLFKDEITKFQHACPSCTYKTANEPQLKYSMLACMDGNESLKRVLRTRKGREGEPVGVERLDTRHRESHLFLRAEEVDVYKDEVKRRQPPPIAAQTTPDAQETAEDGGKSDEEEEEEEGEAVRRVSLEEGDDEGSPVDGVTDESPCADRWSNLAAEAKKRMWGIFSETGIFLAACRHGVVLQLCDMIRSGELYVLRHQSTTMTADTHTERSIRLPS